MTDYHRAAEALMADGDRALAAGDRDTFRRAYSQAGLLESHAFDEIPVDRPRTRGVIAVSSVASLRKAEAFDLAVREAHRFLSDDGLPPEARDELEALLEDTKAQQSVRTVRLAAGYRWALRGGRVGYGVARMDTVTLKNEQIQRFMWRVYEMLSGLPFRTTEPVPAGVRAAVDLLVSQPVAGSYAFDVKVGEYQIPLEPNDAPSMDEFNDAIGEILSAVGSEDAQAIDEIVPDPRYRDILIAMVRNLSPDGREVGEVTVQKLGTTQPPALLTPVVRSALNRRLRRHRPGQSEPQETELRDVLRVIDLNRRHIALGPRDREQSCRVPDDLGLVDLVQGLEDRPVRVRGHWQGKTFVVHDIEADYGDEN